MSGQPNLCNPFTLSDSHQLILCKPMHCRDVMVFSAIGGVAVGRRFDPQSDLEPFSAKNINIDVRHYWWVFSTRWQWTRHKWKDSVRFNFTPKEQKKLFFISASRRRLEVLQNKPNCIPPCTIFLDHGFNKAFLRGFMRWHVTLDTAYEGDKRRRYYEVKAKVCSANAQVKQLNSAGDYSMH
jgi:hypothetical protein